MLGDSYSTPGYCVSPVDSFWGLAASHLEVETVLNYSWPGNNLDSIVHILISEQNKIDWAQDFLLIGIPPLERLTVFDDFKDTKYNVNQLDTTTWTMEPVPLTCHTGLKNIPGWEAEKMVVYSDRSWTETQALSKLFLLASWLDSVGASYLVANLAKPLDENNAWGPTEFLLPWAKSRSDMILFNDTYYSVNEHVHKPADFYRFKWQGHHGPAGNKHFFEKSIKNRLC